MAFTAIAFIPLAIQSTVEFTTGPFLAALLAFIIIREKLAVNETVCIVCGMVGTLMLTMPEWFMFMGIQKE